MSTRSHGRQAADRGMTSHLGQEVASSSFPDHLEGCRGDRRGHPGPQSQTKVATGYPCDDTRYCARDQRRNGRAYRVGGADCGHRNLQESAPILTEEVPYGPEGGLAEAAHEAVAGGVGKVDGGIADIAVAV